MLFEIIKAFIAVLIPLLFTALIAKYPDFPLTAQQLVALALWLVGLLFAGAKIAKVREIYRSRYR